MFYVRLRRMYILWWFVGVFYKLVSSNWLAVLFKWSFFVDLCLVLCIVESGYEVSAYNCSIDEIFPSIQSVFASCHAYMFIIFFLLD